MTIFEEALQVELSRWTADSIGDKAQAFEAGARWADAAPQGDFQAEATRRFGEDERARMFRAGAAWSTSRSRSAEVSKAEERSLQTPGKLYIGAIFPGADERGIDFEAVVSEDLESLKITLESLVRQRNSDDEDIEALEYSWEGLDFYPEDDSHYGDFTWARIQETTAGTPVRISEYNF